MKINNKTSQSIGFVGAGNMGLPMLKNLIKQGYEVKVYDINPKITKKLEKDKIKSVNNLRGIANNNFIISILPDTNDVENVFNDRTGINSYLKPGTIVIDMSTISSKSAIDIGKTLQKIQVDFLVSTLSLFTLIILFKRSFFKHLNNVALGCLQLLIRFSRLIILSFSCRNNIHKNMSRSVKDNLSSPNFFSWSLNRDHNFAKDIALLCIQYPP